MKHIIIFLSIFFLPFFLTAQESDAVYQARVGQRIAELELDDELSLWICDADSGLPLQGVLVAIENSGSVTTDRDGLAVFPVVKDGDHNFIMKKDGYIMVKDKFTVFGGAIFFNKYSIPKLMPIKHIKIVLDWGEAPNDLDLHLIKVDNYHISYRFMQRSEDGFVFLDRDDTDKYGPETLTITTLDNSAKYQVFVHDYSNKDSSDSRRLASSIATVRVYTNNRLAYTFHIDSQTKGTLWNVFEIVNGKIIPTGSYQ
jgi:hypothetical protein